MTKLEVLTTTAIATLIYGVLSYVLGDTVWFSMLVYGSIFGVVLYLVATKTNWMK